MTAVFPISLLKDFISIQRIPKSEKIWGAVKDVIYCDHRSV